MGFSHFHKRAVCVCVCCVFVAHTIIKHNTGKIMKKKELNKTCLAHTNTRSERNVFETIVARRWSTTPAAAPLPHHLNARLTTQATTVCLQIAIGYTHTQTHNKLAKSSYIWRKKKWTKNNAKQQKQNRWNKKWETKWKLFNWMKKKTLKGNWCAKKEMSCLIPFFGHILFIPLRGAAPGIIYFLFATEMAIKISTEGQNAFLHQPPPSRQTRHTTPKLFMEIFRIQ